MTIKKIFKKNLFFSSYEERSNAPHNKAFMHLQTAVTAMPPTSKALPKPRTTPSFIHPPPQPPSITRASPPSTENKLTSSPPNKSFQSQDSTTSLLPNSNVSPFVSDQSAATQNVVHSQQNITPSTQDNALNLKIPALQNRASSIPDTICPPSNGSLIKHNPISPEKENSAISVIQKPISLTSYNSTSSRTQFPTNNSSSLESKSFSSQPKNSVITCSELSNVSETPNTLNLSAQNNSGGSSPYCTGTLSKNETPSLTKSTGNIFSTGSTSIDFSVSNPLVVPSIHTTSNSEYKPSKVTSRLSSNTSPLNNSERESVAAKMTHSTSEISSSNNVTTKVASLGDQASSSPKENNTVEKTLSKLSPAEMLNSNPSTSSPPLKILEWPPQTHESKKDKEQSFLLSVSDSNGPQTESQQDSRNLAGL